MRRTQIALMAVAASLAAGGALAAAPQERSYPGKVSSIDERHITVESARGQKMDFAIVPTTVCQRGQTTLAQCDAQAGEHVTVVFERAGATNTAIRVKLLAKPAKAATVYVCPMHPEVVSNQPGKCPKCGMNLEPKKAAK